MTVINHASHVTVACRQDIRITNTMLLNENIESSEVSDMHIACLPMFSCICAKSV